jgi:hypothetical protein
VIGGSYTPSVADAQASSAVLNECVNDYLSICPRLPKLERRHPVSSTKH